MSTLDVTLNLRSEYPMTGASKVQKTLVVAGIFWKLRCVEVSFMVALPDEPIKLVSFITFKKTTLSLSFHMSSGNEFRHQWQSSR